MTYLSIYLSIYISIYLSIYPNLPQSTPIYPNLPMKTWLGSPTSCCSLGAMAAFHFSQSSDLGVCEVCKANQHALTYL